MAGSPISLAVIAAIAHDQPDDLTFGAGSTLILGVTWYSAHCVGA